MVFLNQDEKGKHLGTAGKLKNFSYEERLRKLTLPSTKKKRLRGNLINVFQISEDNAEYFSVVHSNKAMDTP